MHSLSFSDFLLIAASFLLAMLLSILPLPAWLELMSPQWLTLVLIYWILTLPYQINLWTAWSIGLLMDILHGNLLGEHALTLTLTAYLTHRFHMQIRMSPITQQTFCILSLLLVNQLLLTWIQIMTRQTAQFHWLWPSLLVSTFLWPIVNAALRLFRRRFRIAIFL